MSITEDILNRVGSALPGGYLPDSPPASEPTAWGAIALARAGRIDEARRACQWLVECQQKDGSVGVTLQEQQPAWPTSLAMLAWQESDHASSDNRFQHNVQHAKKWALSTRGRTVERKPEIGHDTTLVGWSWAADTHSWLEPTALFVRALRTTGQEEHPRTREATRLLVDRLLPAGGANYGNTRVLDQYLLPHVQPTGLVLWALADLEIADPRIASSLNYLEASLERPLGTASLAYATMGLKAHGHAANAAITLLTEKAKDEQSPYKLSLIANALL